ncbi:GIY-YIG nuclease family protein [Candidatus Parcubacteria bacterium]|jgi:putative endonuclease|nr:GIY-YIG nuclease family protein [Candidatus Parcubacteria bacterium]MBT3949392.1 GIY-YIG nuclease family protein [Candidatus Parcubacteria bacterium]
MNGYIYILQSLKNNKYYIGSTNDVGRRIDEHNAGRTKSIKYLIPWQLRFVQKYPTIKQACQVEYKLKKLKSRKIIKQIIVDKKINMGP